MKILSYKKNETDKFEILCRRLFKFLEKDFNCKEVIVERSVYGTCVIYKNLTTVVEVGFKPIDGYAFIRVIRLVNGKIPPYEEVKRKSIINDFYLLDIINFYNPSLNSELPPLKEWENYHVLKEKLLQQAEYLNKYASDILKGDFSIFPELEKIVKKRAGVLKEGKKKK